MTRNLPVSLGLFSNGIIFVWSSPFSLVITQDKVNYDISEEEASYFIVIQPVGMITCSLFYFKIADFLGRKKALFFLTVPYLISWLITIFAKSKFEFYAARFIAGIGDTAAFCSIPSYVGEILSPSIRGFWGNFPLFMHYCGHLFINVAGSYLSVQTTAYICIAILVVFALLLTALPESPYQLIKDGKFDAAKKSIRWLRRKPNIEQDFQSMKADVDRQLSERGKWKDLFLIDSNRKALKAGCFLRISQQLCGITVFATYSQTIFQKAGGNLSPQISSIIFSSLVCSLNLICCSSVDKWGRKLSYFYSLIASGTVLIAMAVFFFIDQFQFANLDKINWFPLAGMISFVFTYSFGLGVVPTLMLSELFSASIKFKGICILIIAWGVAVVVTTNLFHLLTANVGLYAPFLVFGVCCWMSTILTIRWVPETKGKTLEEIQQSLKR
ncbi:hypothetical protein D910_02992, partial [Dendroctonus ponderosae]